MTSPMYPFARELTENEQMEFAALRQAGNSVMEAAKLLAAKWPGLLPVHLIAQEEQERLVARDATQSRRQTP